MVGTKHHLYKSLEQVTFRVEKITPRLRRSCPRKTGSNYWFPGFGSGPNLHPWLSHQKKNILAVFSVASSERKWNSQVQKDWDLFFRICCFFPGVENDFAIWRFCNINSWVRGFDWPTLAFHNLRFKWVTGVSHASSEVVLIPTNSIDSTKNDPWNKEPSYPRIFWRWLRWWFSFSQYGLVPCRVDVGKHVFLFIIGFITLLMNVFFSLRCINAWIVWLFQVAFFGWALLDHMTVLPNKIVGHPNWQAGNRVPIPSEKNRMLAVISSLGHTWFS